MASTDRLTAEQRAKIRTAVASWPPLSERQREAIRTLFDGYQHQFSSPT